MHEMNDAEYKEFMMHGTRTGKLATVQEDGQPHVAPVWFIMDEDDIFFTTYKTTVKAADMRRDPRVTLCVDDQQPPYSFAMVEGRVDMEERPPDMLQWTTRIARRYMGEELAKQYGRRNDADGELLVRIRPTKVIARKNIAE